MGKSSINGSFSMAMLNNPRVMFIIIANQPDALQKMTNSLLVDVDIPINTKKTVRISRYPCKIDLQLWPFIY